MKACLTMLLRTAFVISVSHLPAGALAEVEGNCTMCHKYPGLGRIEQLPGEQNDKIKRIFYINNALFEASYHGKIRCGSCHTGVDRIPHQTLDEVNCASDCHILDPSSNRPFSHKKIVEDFDNSAHGKKGSRSEDKGDLPVCKDCHNNKPYHASVAERAGAKEFMNVCLECHQSEDFVDRFYEHMIYRTSKRRPSKEVIKLCSTCHADQALMTKHDLEAVIGFGSTFHAKAISYGNEEVANCLSCHAPYQLGFSPHRISSHRNEGSPVSAENKIETCRQSRCHTKAGEEFAAGGRVHPSPGMVRILAGVGTVNIAKDELDDETVFQAKVIGWIQLFYKVLIVVVVGGLALHRILDLYASRRERRLGGH